MPPSAEIPMLSLPRLLPVLLIGAAAPAPLWIGLTVWLLMR